MSYRFDRRSGSPSRGGRPSGGGRPSSGGRPSGGGRAGGGRAGGGRSSVGRSSDSRASDGRSSDGPSSGGRSSGGGPGGSRPGGGGRSFEDRSRGGRYGDRRRDDNAASGRGSFRDRPSEQRGSYRARREDESGEGSGGQFRGRRFESDRSKPDRFKRDRPNRDRDRDRDRDQRDGSRFESRSSERFGERSGGRYGGRSAGTTGERVGGRRFSQDRTRRRGVDDRRDQRPAWGGSSRSDASRLPPSRPLDSNTNAPTSESETFGPQPADDLIWGRHATQAALETGRPIHRIWCTTDLRSAPRFLQLLRDAKSSGVLVEEVTWARLAQLTGGAVHQGIALQTAAAETLDLSSLIEGCADLGESPLLLALDGLTDPHNLGAIVRSAEALGAHGLVLPQRRSAGLTGSVAKVAAGALEHLPVARVVNLNRSLETLKQSGYRVIGLAEEGDVTLPEVDLEGPLVLVTGSENQGLSLLTRRHCDQLVRIPLRGVTPSLNASVATALCLYELARRGWMKELQGQAPSPRIVRPHCIALPDAEKDSENSSEKDSENGSENVELETNVESVKDSDQEFLADAGGDFVVPAGEPGFDQSI